MLVLCGQAHNNNMNESGSFYFFFKLICNKKNRIKSLLTLLQRTVQQREKKNLIRAFMSFSLEDLPGLYE